MHRAKSSLHIKSKRSVKSGKGQSHDSTCKVQIKYTIMDLDPDIQQCIYGGGGGVDMMY